MAIGSWSGHWSVASTASILLGWLQDFDWPTDDCQTEKQSSKKIPTNLGEDPMNGIVWDNYEVSCWILFDGMRRDRDEVSITPQKSSGTSSTEEPPKKTLVYCWVCQFLRMNSVQRPAKQLMLYISIRIYTSVYIYM